VTCHLKRTCFFYTEDEKVRFSNIDKEAKMDLILIFSRLYHDKRDLYCMLIESLVRTRLNELLHHIIIWS
jgi:hypothetical protein